MLGGAIMSEMTSKLEYLAEKKPEKLVELAKKMHRQNPEEVEGLLETVEEGGHITNRQKYEELVGRLKWSNKKGRGERWKLDEIAEWEKINFKDVDYTKYDLAYLVNMLYAKCSKHYTDSSMFFKLAKCLLEDEDEETKMYRGAEHSKHKHNKSGMQSYYDEEDYENRRYRNEESRRGRRRYRSEAEDYEDNEDYRGEYRSGERYHDDDYDRSENRRHRYYQESNVGFRT